MRTAVQSGPAIWLLGDVEHPDFAEAIALVQATADVGASLPELIVLAQSRPGMNAARDVARLRRSAPLAGIVALCGSWCEGETRTGRPAAGVPRLYWYEFPAWWRRQLALRAAGRCPDWAQPATLEFPRQSTAGQVRHGESSTSSGTRAPQAGAILVDAFRWETTEALGDVLRSAGFSSIWRRLDGAVPPNVVAGIWEGGQLDDAEAERLAALCAKLAAHNAPVVALLDFPRRDRCEVARRAGAATVLGKPWLNVDLAETLRQVITCRREFHSSNPLCAA